MAKSKEMSEWLKDHNNREKVVSNEEVNALRNIIGVIDDVEENVSSDDEVNEDLEADSCRLNEILGLPSDTYSLTRIMPNLPECMKYGVRSGVIHMHMNKFSPLSRGLQGPAIAIVAYATTGLIETRNWNEPVIDQIIEDGDTYYCESYKQHNILDRRLFGVNDLNKSMNIQKTHRAHVHIDDAVYTGVFRWKNPTEMHLVKALELFFNEYDAGLLTSSHLNISIWRNGEFFNIFDGQSRRDNNLLPDKLHGCAKLILLYDLTGVLYIILEKSNVMDEHFVLYPLKIVGISRIIDIDVNKPEKFVDTPQRRPSGYNIHGLRALARGTFHMMHDSIPEIIRGHTHLIIAITAIIYSHLIHSNKWTTAIIDLIFNQANIYFVDLVRAIEKKIDDKFVLNIDDLLGDIFLGVYVAKVKIQSNIIPGDGKKIKGKSKGKGKLTLDTGFREFFEEYKSALLEIKNIFYAVWKDGDKYYFFDPLACDSGGIRVDSTDPEVAEKYKSATSCVSMYSTIDDITEAIFKNTDSTEKDPFILHGIQVLYVKTGSYSQGLPYTIIYREKKTNRRPLPLAQPSAPIKLDEYKIKMDTVPKPRTHADKCKTEACQYPELLRNIDDYMMKDNEFIMNTNADKEKIVGYKIINPHRIILHGTKNCLLGDINESIRGWQGLSMAITAMAYSKLKNPSRWRNFDIDKIIDFGNQMHRDLIKRQKSDSLDNSEDDDDDDEDESDDSNDSDNSDDSDDSDNEDDTDEDDDEVEEESDDEIFENKIKNKIDVTLLPDEIKFGDYYIKVKGKNAILEGDADPMVNLGEAFDQYFTKYDELILENKHLMYGIWKMDGYFFTFNPYGGNDEGWRLRDYSASFIVTDTINELVDLFHGILEFNDRKFLFHFIHITSIEPQKYVSSILIEMPKWKMGKYQTLFLPLTDDDLAESKIKSNDKNDEISMKKKNKEKSGNDEENMEDEEGNENISETEDGKEKKVKKKEETNVEEEKELSFEDLFMDIDEKERLDAPSHLNLFLLTANVKLEDENIDPVAKEALEYERLKYNHPPPYVLPPKRVLSVLLGAKKASKSISSLVSCFSIDSKLAVKIDFTLNEKINSPTINNINGEEKSKIIKLPPRKYLYSRISPIGFTPLRAINEKFIYDEKFDEKHEDETEKESSKTSPGIYIIDEVPDEEDSPEGVRITPTILPLGPLIKTPLPKVKTKSCVENKKRPDKLSNTERNNEVIPKLICNSENILFNMIFSKVKSTNVNEDNVNPKDEQNQLIELKSNEIPINELTDNNDEEVNKVELPPETVGFQQTVDGYRILFSNMKLNNRNNFERYHFKACYFAAILCILAKTREDVHEFRSSLLDELIILANKIYQRTGNLRYKERRSINNIEFHDVTFNIIMRQNVYADPKNHEPDALSNTLEEYLKKNSSGILVFENASYAFWFVNDKYRYYLFDPYACDEMGRINENGNACLLEFPHITDLIKKIEQHCGVGINEPYRIHSMLIAHIERIKQRKTLKKKLRRHNEEILHKVNNKEKEKVKEKEEIDKDLISNNEKPVEMQKPSLIELTDWLNDKNKISYKFDINLSGFTALTNVNASVFEVTVIENDITQPNPAPFSSTDEIPKERYKNLLEVYKRKSFDRKFNKHSILSEPLDLCIMAWSCIHEPTVWGMKTIRGIYDASQDLAYDSLLSAEDTTVGNMIDGVLNEFDIANYRFHVTFAPIHLGKLYSNDGWNLAMSVKKIFNTSIYTGAIISCGKSHIGIMKVNVNFYAWWTVTGTKNLRIVTSRVMEDFLKLIIQEINEINEAVFKMRAVLISNVKKLDPDCTDMKGLHEPTATNSLPQIYRRQISIYNLQTLFRSTVPDSDPIFILGTVALQQYELIKEPQIKRCYFVAILAVMVKRDIMQNLMPNMIDKIMQIGEGLYREFKNPKYHTEHILRNVTIMNRIFDFRDVASPLYKFQENISTETDDFYLLLKKKLKQHFKRHSHGILHFTNCCYGFWYSPSTNLYYYFDPYQCNSQGERVLKNGSGCLGIFPSLSQMVKLIMLNRAINTTGFFIHHIHVESINIVPSKKFVEDPMWIYLDYHWSASHAPLNVHCNRKKNQNESVDMSDHDFGNETFVRPTWNHYTIEIPNLIYSIWGTLGAYDTRFGERAGKNQIAISVAVLAMQYLCHPSKWNAAILDSAVICGDCYYTESVKIAAQRGIKYTNSFNLQPHFKVFPHIWRIEYGGKMYGMLYGGNKRMTLAATLKLAIEESSNILIKCGKITLAVISTDDGYYAADPCWTGPPLFLQNHGALYVLRCRNLSTLVYALVKMINTNERLEFTVIPVKFNFKHENCVTGNQKNRKMKKRILSDTVECQPSHAISPQPPVSGAIAVTDNDIYLDYCKKVECGIECGIELENPSVPSPVPQLDEDATRNLMISTEWHKNIGRGTRKKYSRLPLETVEFKFKSKTFYTSRVPSCDDYPKNVDFHSKKFVTKSIKSMTKTNIAPKSPFTKPSDYLPPLDFTMERSRKNFEKQSAEITDNSFEIYKYKHYVDYNNSGDSFDGDDDDDIVM